MIDQLTVFLSNAKGRLTAMCKAIGDAGVDMHALVVADTTDYGIVRIICDKPQVAADALRESGFSATIAQVVGVKVEGVPGGLAEVLAALDATDMNIEYGYCFAHSTSGATVALKTEKDAVKVLTDAGFSVVDQSDLD